MKRTCLIVILFCFAHGYTYAQTYTLKSFSFSNGVGTVQSSSFKLTAIVGQDIVGTTSSANFQLSTGFAPSASVPLPDLTIENLAFTASVAPGQTITDATFTLKNTGDADVTGTITVNAYLSANVDLDAGDIVLATFTFTSGLLKNSQISFPQAGQSRAIPIPANTTVGLYHLFLKVDPSNVIVEGNELNNAQSKNLTVSITGVVDTSPPAFSDPVDGLFITGKFVSLINVTDASSGVKEVLFFHRPIIGTTFTSQVVTPPASGSNYDVLLLKDWADVMGMEFYFKATDNLGNSAETDHHFLFLPADETAIIPNLAAGGKLSDYRIFSIPYKLDKAGVADIFGSVLGSADKTKWRLVHYLNGRNIDSDVITSIELGKGYWFNSKVKADIKIGAGSVAQVNQSGVGGSGFQMKLVQGWNQIGDPFPFNVDWSDIVQANPLVVGKTDKVLNVFDPATVSFKESDNLAVWGGGFVFANEAITLNLPVTLKNTAGGRKAASNKIMKSSLDQNEWLVPLTLRQGKTENTLCGFGMHPEARISKDPFDKQTLPRFLNYLEMSAYHPEFFYPWFSKDVVPTNKNYTWQFEVESSSNENEIELSWNRLALGQNEARLLLFDVQAQELIDMKQTDRYRFANDGNRKLKIFFAENEKALQPDVTLAGTPYPNPVTSSVTIPFVIAADQTWVEISVYDMMGKKVKEIVNNSYDPGLYHALWEGTDLQGTKVSHGMYLYRMTINGKATVATGRLIVQE